MKELLFVVLPLVALAGCNSRPDTGWTVDCEKHHSVDSREFKQCQSRIKSTQPNAAPGQVVIEPDGTETPQEQDIGKGHSD